MKNSLEIKSLTEFDVALQELFEEKGINGDKYNSSIFHNNLKEQQRHYLEFREEFRKRYGFSEELFDLSLRASSAKELVEFIEDVLKDRKYRVKMSKLEETLKLINIIEGNPNNMLNNKVI